MLPLLFAAAALTAGQPAPPLALEQWLSAPPGAPGTSPALRGNALVLEFWATWCAPCVEQIPHWNALVEKFKGRAVQFIAISYEEPDTVAALIQRHPIAGWVGIDAAGATFKAYGVEAVPLTVLVDAKGIVRGVTSPRQLTEADIDGLLAGRELKLAPPAAPG